MSLSLVIWGGMLAAIFLVIGWVTFGAK